MSLRLKILFPNVPNLEFEKKYSSNSIKVKKQYNPQHIKEYAKCLTAFNLQIFYKNMF